ncbi:unnamed protein product, partial [Vitis vinifera]
MWSCIVACKLDSQSALIVTYCILKTSYRFLSWSLSMDSREINLLPEHCNHCMQRDMRSPLWMNFRSQRHQTRAVSLPTAIHLACRMTTQIFVAPSLFLLFLCVSVCTLLSTDLVNRVAPGTLGAGLNPIRTISNLILSKLGRFLVSMTLEVSSLLKKGAAKKA